MKGASASRKGFNNSGASTFDCQAVILGHRPKIVKRAYQIVEMVKNRNGTTGNEWDQAPLEK